MSINKLLNQNTSLDMFHEKKVKESDDWLILHVHDMTCRGINIIQRIMTLYILAVIAFRNKSKFSAWKTWNAYEEVTVVFIIICSFFPIISSSRSTALRILCPCSVRWCNTWIWNYKRIAQIPLRNKCLFPTFDAISLHTHWAIYQDWHALG